MKSILGSAIMTGSLLVGACAEKPVPPPPAPVQPPVVTPVVKPAKKVYKPKNVAAPEPEVVLPLRPDRVGSRSNPMP